jgi:hypothetical protein
MSQKQFNNYQDDILSFDLREAMLGVLKPGRYCGFDTFTHVSTSSGVIHTHLSHAGTGIQKADKTTPTPVLGLKTGVAVTPQGLIIHDDATTIDVNIDDGSGNGGSTRYDVVYLEHYYLDGVPGSNPATYGIKKGTPGSGTPALAYPSKQVGLVLVTIPTGVTTFASLTFTPIKQELGDLTIADTLLSMVGTLTGYTEQNYITNGQTVTASLNVLDMILKDKSDLIAAIPNTKLDDWATPDDNTDLNASITRHGLLPKLNNSLVNFLNGQGTWTAPSGSRFKQRSGIPIGADFSYNIGTGGSQDFDLSAIVTDTNVDYVLIEIEGYCISNPVILSTFFWVYPTGLQSGNVQKFSIPGIPSSTGQAFIFHRIPTKISASKIITFEPGSGVSSLASLEFRVIGWQTPD